MKFLDEIFKNKYFLYVNGLTDELKVAYIYQKYKRENKNIICITNTLYEANKVFSSLINYEKDTLLFPMDDFLTSEALAISPELMINRLETLKNVVTGKGKKIIVTNLMGYLRYLPKKEVYEEKTINLKVTDEISIEKLIDKLYGLGYKRDVVVNKTGDIAIRGFIVDVFPITYKNPIRIEFWGDQIESIREFDVDSQLALGLLNEISIFPVSEFLIDTNEFKTQKELPEFGEVCSISEYLDNLITVYYNKNNIDRGYELLLEEINEYKKLKEEDCSYINSLEKIQKGKEIFLNDFNEEYLSDSSINYQTSTVPCFYGNFKTLKDYLKKETNKTIIICLRDRYKVNKLIEELVELKPIFTNQNEIFDKKINLIIQKINEGYIINKYLVLSETEIFNTREQDFKYKTNFKYGSKIKDLNKLNIGDYVVSAAHGIGRYLGLKVLTKNGFKKDYLQIEYANNDKLYVPVERLELISKYSSKEGNVPKINRLGSSEWEKTKAKVRKKLEDIAGELIELYTKREMSEGFAFNKDDELQVMFEQSFEHKETKDQLRALEDIKKDMESNKPMDRILCGDVGFGKTEVAFRAIFKAILSGKQTAILCPTTILSNQHFNTAVQRFSEFPIRIKLLNRFVSKRKQHQTLEKLSKGEVDLLIGTHRILSDDVIFKDLGLLIIDEEQRFGVKHKEKIKKYKNNIDVLSLSATPIPRTLQMSMTGVRSLSLIETPPRDRLPIQTFVMEENDYVIKSAIYKELQRDGQVFILFNRIKEIELIKIKINNLVREAKIAVAHGKMNKELLERTMNDFIDKKYDVLISTTIIETGIDIPNANTLIIIDADRFGLAQLYQVRGRVGRSSKIAYCYLMYNNTKILSDIANKRLQAVKEFTELGSGFQIAMRDLAIRGAGDLLGSEQAGFIDSVGIEMFMNILTEEINKQKGIVAKEEIKTLNNLVDVETSIDSKYVNEEELRIELHKRINEIKNEEDINNLIKEFDDRFGNVDENMKIYMYQEWFEELARELKIDKVNQTKNFIEIEINDYIKNNIDGTKLFNKVYELGKHFRFKNRFKKTFIVLDAVKSEKHFIYYLIDLMKIIKESFN